MRAEAHLRIGRLLAAHIPAGKREEAIFEIVNQLDRGAALITSRDEREQLAELNLLAGQARQGLCRLRVGADLSHRRSGAAAGRLVGAPARADLRAGAAPGRMRVSHRRAGGRGAAPGGAVDPRRKYGGTRLGRLPARRSVHDPRSGQPRRCRRSRLPPASGIDWSPHPTEEERDANTSGSGAAREPHDRGSDRAAVDDRPGIARDDGRSDEVVPACIPYGCEPACPHHLPGGQLSLERGNCDASCNAYVFLA